MSEVDGHAQEPCLPHSDRSGDSLYRLPPWPGLREDDQAEAVAAMKHVFAKAPARTRVAT